MGKASAKKKSPSTAVHPPYFEMISDAISTLKERTGSSQQAIAKFIEDKHNKVLPPNFRKLLSVQLKNFVKSQRLYKVKNSYKISPTDTNKATSPNKHEDDKKVIEKRKKKKKTKSLSQVKTPETLKTKATTTNNKKNKKDGTKKKSVVVVASSGSGGKVKRLSQVKTPEAMKKKPNLAPMKRKTTTPKPINSSRPTRNARK